MKGSGITLYKSGEPEVPTIEEFLKKELEEGAVLGFDGRTVSYAQGEKYRQIAEGEGASIEFRLDLAPDTGQVDLKCLQSRHFCWKTNIRARILNPN